MATNPIYDPPANHWVYLPRLRNVTGFDKLTNNSFVKLRDTLSPYAKPYEKVLRSAGIWNSSSSHLVDYMTSSVTANFSQGVYYKQVGSDFIPTTISPSEIKSLIDYVENTPQEQRDQDNREQIIIDINNSQYGCIEAVQEGISRELRPKFYFQKNGSQVEKNKSGNSIGIKNNIAFVGVPKTAAGTPYAANLTQKTDQIGTYESGEVNDDVKNTVAGELDMNYNPNTGKFEFASNFLAKLITDLEAVPIAEVNLDIQSIQGRTSSDFYGRNAPEKMSEFTTGAAVPLSMQNKNPHCYGPNILKCKTSSKVETVRVVNRSNISFKKGEIVTVFKIDGENIIGKYTSDTFVQLPAQPGRWVFSQFYVNSDEYFRYQVLFPLIARPGISPDECINLLRKKYYEGLSTQTPNERAINFDTSWDTGSIFPYYPWHVFDLIEGNTPEQEEGQPPPQTTYKSYFNRINSTQGVIIGGSRQDAPVGIGYQNEYPMFWGPVFTNGLVSKVNRQGLWGCNFPDEMHTPAFAAMPNNLTNRYANTFGQGLISRINENPRTVIFWPYSHLNTSNIRYPAYPSYNTEYPIYGSGFVNARNPLTVQFSLLSADLVGAGDSVANYGASWWPKMIEEPIWGTPSSAATNKIRAFNTNSVQILKSYLPEVSLPETEEEFIPGVSSDEFTPTSVGNFLVSKTIARRPFDSKSRLNFYTQRESSFLRGKQVEGGGLTLPYDLYLDYEPLSRPSATFAMWGGDTAPRTEEVAKFRGANGIGITSARLRMNQGSGGSWTSNLQVDQAFGMKGRWFGGGGGGGIAVTIIGALLAWADDNRGRRIDGMVPTWGSRDDSIDSFGGAAIHAQAWDAWPDEQTVWIPQYFTAMHFNPMFPGSSTIYDSSVERPTRVKVTNYKNAVKRPNTDTWEVEPDSNFELFVFPPVTSVDYRVPTFGSVKRITNANGTISEFPEYSINSSAGIYDPTLNGVLVGEIVDHAGLDGVTIPAGTIITSGTPIRQESLWNVNINRRAKLVTKYGYFYRRRVIGVDVGSLTLVDDPNDTNANYPWDLNFNDGDEFEVGDGVVVKYNSSLLHRFEVKLNTQEELFKPLKDQATGDASYTPTLDGTINWYARGSGLLPRDFGVGGKRYAVKPKGGGRSRFISFSRGLCYDAWAWDRGPIARSNITRLTSNSGSGNDYITGLKSTSIQVLGNSEHLYRGQYELFFHVHNDISFVLHEPPEYTAGNAIHQRFILSIT